MFFSCKSDDIANTKFRNHNYYWFVEEGSVNGKWVKISYDENNESLKEGHCTGFYKNGIIREKFNVNKFGKSDTIFFYNLSEELTHYSVNKGKIENYFYNNGPFKAYLPSGSLILTGEVNNNVLVKRQWHGDFKLFYILIKSSTGVWNNSNRLFKDVIRF